MGTRALAHAARLFDLGAVTAAPWSSPDAVGRDDTGADLLRWEEILQGGQARKLTLGSATREVVVQVE
jgi:hypothetical protein